MLPYVYDSPLKRHSATKINLHGLSGSVLFRNHLKDRISLLRSSVLRPKTIGVSIEPTISKVWLL